MCPPRPPLSSLLDSEYEAPTLLQNVALDTGLVAAKGRVKLPREIQLFRGTQKSRKDTVDSSQQRE